MDQTPRKADYQTASIFLILAVLTSVFVLGLRWALLAPTQRVTNIPQVPVVEKANR